MRLRLLAFASLALLAACASNEYSSVPEPKGEWVAVNPPGFRPQPPARPARPTVRRARFHRRPAAPPRATPLRTVQTAPPPAAPAAEAHP